MADLIAGRNPVRELLRSGQKTINKIYVSHQAHGDAITDIIKLAKTRGVPLHHVPAAKMDNLKCENNQGVIAELSCAYYLELEELIEKISTETKPLAVVLDGIEDPHNAGAIIRNAVAFGAHGIIIGKWRGAGLTETVVRTSAGASEHILIARVTNIAESVSRLKEAGFWVVGAEAGNKDVREESFSFPLAVVIGSEGQGIHRLVKERCDNLVSIPFTKKVSSLNASCAAAIILYEIYKQKSE